jgi:acid phosphatase
MIRLILQGIKGLFLLLLILLVPAPLVHAQNPLGKINHVIILYLENHTVDNLYSGLPGVNGINSPGGVIPQLDLNDKPYGILPPVVVSFKYDGFGNPVDTLPGVPDPRFPKNLPNKPYLLDSIVPNNVLVGTPLHRFYHYQLQINGGAMNKYVAWTDVGAQVMGYYDTTRLPLYPYARDYTFADNFFTAAFGGSWLNHMWLICACTPVWKNAPPEYIAKPQFDAQGKLVGVDTGENGIVSPDGYGIDTGIDSFYAPHGKEDDAHRLPPQDFPTIGDRLTAAGVSWNEYNGGWRDALDGRAEEPIPLLQEPPLASHAYFKPYGPGMPGRDHLKDAQDFVPDLINGNLSAVTILKPEPAFDEHPGYSIVEEAEKHALLLIEAVQLSRYWQDTAIFITYDDYGGWYDHVPPPVIDRWGPGARVPLLVISPYAKKQFVDHTQYDTTSLLKFIETRWNLQPLATRDAATNDLSNAFDFSQTPTTPVAPNPAVGQDKAPTAVPAQSGGGNGVLSNNVLIAVGVLAVVLIGLAVLLLRRRKPA